MDMGYIYTLKQVLNMKAIGKMICSMAQEFRLMLTEINMKACLNKVKEMEKAIII
jgi:type IV secretory pathway VirB9-like protein